MTSQQGGFDQARVFTDATFLKLLQKHGLPENASLAQVEEKATSLLDSPLTVIDGASLVLGRTIDASEKRYSWTNIYGWSNRSRSIWNCIANSVNGRHGNSQISFKY